MPFNKINAVNEIKRALHGADPRTTHSVLQTVIDDYAERHKKKMCVFPQCGYAKKGNHDWEDMKRLINASSSMNTPLVTIMENRHCGTTILNSSPSASYWEEPLPDGRFRVFVSMDVAKPVQHTSFIDEVANLEKSPYSKKRKLPEIPTKAIPTTSHFVPAPEEIPHYVPAPEEIPEFMGLSEFNLSSIALSDLSSISFGNLDSFSFSNLDSNPSTPPPSIDLRQSAVSRPVTPPGLAPIVIAPQTVIVVGSPARPIALARSPTRPIIIRSLAPRNLL